MKQFTTVLAMITAAGIVAAPALAQNYPPPAPQYPQQAPPPPQYPQQQYPQQQYPQQQYPQQAPAQQYPQQQAPYYGQPQQYPQQAPYFPPQQLDGMVGRIALYPDPLLAQVLTASTFSNEIPEADGWARAHAYLNGGDGLARAIQDDNLPWDPSVIALLPFPSVLDTMSGDMGWTQQLGNAVLADRGAVMDAIQRQRALAMSYGYLRTGGEIRVVTPAPGDIEILPVDPAFVYVPYYDPYVVFARPRPGFFIGGAIRFGPRIGIGVFAPWGWGGVSFGWRTHAIIVNNRPWERTWVNRGGYVHPYAAPRPHVLDRRMEHHELREYHAPGRPEGRRPEERRDERRDDRR
jgi:hypothetical protein